MEAPKPTILSLTAATVACAYLATRLLRFLHRPTSTTTLEGELVVLTGAAGGLGRELALAFGRAGSLLALWDIKKESLDETVSWLQQRGVPADRVVQVEVVDVSDADAVAEAAASLRNVMAARDAAATDGAVVKSQAPRVVISNAAVMRGTTVLGSTDEELRRDFATNALGAFWVCRTFLKQALEDGGGSSSDDGGSGDVREEAMTTTTIVFLGSIMAELPAARQSEYCASKAAISKLHECLRWELKNNSKQNASNKARSLLVLPYAIETPMIAGSALLDGPSMRHSFLRKVLPPLKPAAVARRVVDAVLRDEEKVYVPYVVGWITAVLNLLPAFGSDALLGFCGAADGMDGFSGCAPSRGVRGT